MKIKIGFYFVFLSLIRTFEPNMEYSINCNGKLVSMATPQVMGILNVTPDSFFSGSRKQTEREIAERTQQILNEGGTMIDVGGCSTRPGSDPVDEAEEMRRLRYALEIVRREAPDSVVSIDTFRPDVARMTVEEFGADIINDVSEGADENMFRMTARLGVPYVLMSLAPDIREMMMRFSDEIAQLRALGQKDIILDPGFGFGKTLQQNYDVMREMDRLRALSLPILVGISRKRMIWQLLNSDPQQALNGTSVLNTISLLKGGDILRVHDVREAVECVRIVGQMNQH